MELTGIFRLGAWIQYCRDSDATLPVVKGEGRLVEGLKTIIIYCEENNIGTHCLRDVTKWIALLDEKYSDTDRIDQDDAGDLSTRANHWYDEIRNDLGRKPVVALDLESGLNPFELMKLASKSPSKFIPEEIWTKLTEIERSDYSDAANCILLGSATPAVMVTLRGAEASIGNYYNAITGTDVGKKTWRQLTKTMKDRSDELSLDDAFLGYLDYFGENKRNLAQHPNKIYSLRDAVLIFMQVMGLIEDIYRQL